MLVRVMRFIIISDLEKQGITEEAVLGLDRIQQIDFDNRKQMYPFQQTLQKPTLCEEIGTDRFQDTGNSGQSRKSDVRQQVILNFKVRRLESKYCSGEVNVPEGSWSMEVEKSEVMWTFKKQMYLYSKRLN